MKTNTVKGNGKSKSVAHPRAAATTGKTAQKTVADEPEAELVSISELAKRLDINRNAIGDKLAKAGIEPVVDQPNKKLYALTDELEDVLLAEDNPELDAARLRKITAEAELKELELKIKTGDYGSVAEFTEVTQKIFGGLYRRCVINQPKTIARRLAHTRNEAQMAKIIGEEYGKIFQELKKDFKKFLK